MAFVTFWLGLSIKPLGVRECWLMVTDSEMNGSAPKTIWTNFIGSGIAWHREQVPSLVNVPRVYSGLVLKTLWRSARTVWGLNKAMKWDCGGFPTCCCGCIYLFYSTSNLSALSDALTRRPLIKFHAWISMWLKIKFQYQSDSFSLTLDNQMHIWLHNKQGPNKSLHSHIPRSTSSVLFQWHY